MTESIWMEQLKAYSRHIASLGQQIAAEHARVTNWLLHQRGLYALGKLCCFGIALLAVCVHCKQAPTNGILADRLVTAKKGKNAKSARCQLAASFHQPYSTDGTVRTSQSHAASLAY